MGFLIPGTFFFLRGSRLVQHRVDRRSTLPVLASDWGYDPVIGMAIGTLWWSIAVAHPGPFAAQEGL
jgi:hypothetical protein